MKKSTKSFISFLAGILALLLSILACAPFGSDTPPPPVNTAAPALPTRTSRPIPTRAISTPTEELAPAYFTEEFTFTPEYWFYYVLYGDESYFSEYTQDDMLIMELNDVGLYVFNLYDPYIYENVVIDLYATNMGRNSNNINVMCRYSDYGWYEFTIQNDGLYQVWAYDDAGDSGYNMLASGASFAIETGKASNLISVLCATVSDGTMLSLYVNYQEVKTFTDKLYYLPDGQVGFGVNVSPSNPVVPVIVGFDYVIVSEP